MTIACFIRDPIDSFGRDDFKLNAKRWGRVIARCGGHPIGCFVPHKGRVR
jgi:hypothetical protein